METSAKDGSNVNKLFCEVGKILYKETASRFEINKVRLKYLKNIILHLQEVDSDILKQIKLKSQKTENKTIKKCC